MLAKLTANRALGLHWSVRPGHYISCFLSKIRLTKFSEVSSVMPDGPTESSESSLWLNLMSSTRSLISVLSITTKNTSLTCTRTKFSEA
jgi:hypothetical protein